MFIITLWQVEGLFFVLLWQLTDVGLRHLGQNCLNLRSLNLHGCLVWTFLFHWIS